VEYLRTAKRVDPKFFLPILLGLWLRSFVVSVLISLIANTAPTWCLAIILIFLGPSVLLLAEALGTVASALHIGALRRGPTSVGHPQTKTKE
jgi:hypothetical protein